jgi:hypothetical protein
LAETTISPDHPSDHFKRWLLAERIEQVEGPETGESKGRQQPWWKIVCLTGVDYFSTLGYIPGIAALAAGVLSPIATLLIVALTLFAMAPMYRRVAQESPHGQGKLLADYGNPLVIIGVALLVFPKLALGISGFETGVSVMPLVRGEEGDDTEHPEGRIRNTKKLLTSAALIMSFYLITTSFITVVLKPAKEFKPGGSANGRALAYLAHEYFGSAFGTAYDLSTILILAFAGASAMAGLLNIVPRYLPRYGMAPEWGRAIRPLVLIYTAIAFAITVIFNASVDAQGGAYATGVLMIMTSAAFAVMLSALWNDNSLRATLAFGLVTLIFLYTNVANIFERPDGIKIASFFIVAIIVVSLASRVRRSLELRQEYIELDEKAQRYVEDASEGDEIHIIAHRRRYSDDPEEYARKLEEQREYNRVPHDATVLFLEIDVEDPSEFEEEVLEVRGVNVAGYRALRAESTVVPNAIAAFLLYLRDETGETPHCYFGWTEGNPFAYVIRYVLFGEGDTAPVAHEVLREAEPDLQRRPIIHVGGR